MKLPSLYSVLLFGQLDEMYMNIWVVADLASEGTAAYAYYPGTAPDNHEGIICDDDYFGTIGTASNSNWSRELLCWPEY